MDRFTEEEKRELLDASRSKGMRDGFRRIFENRRAREAKNNLLDPGEAVKFAADCNALSGHTPKPF